MTDATYDYGLAPGESFEPGDLEEPVETTRPHIMTALGPILPEELGLCLVHEHVIVRPPGEVVDPDLVLDSEDAALGEIDIFFQLGGRALVDMSTADYGRDAVAVVFLARRSNIHLILATGHHKALFSAPWLGDRSVEEIAAQNTAELTVGIGGTGARAGVIKAGTSLGEILAVEERVLRAAARATGAPISTHTERGTMALEQLAILREEGVDLRRVILGHLDHLRDDGLLLRIAATGAWLSLDQWSKHQHRPDAERAALVRLLIDAGHGPQVLLSGDLARRSNRPGYGGGPGWPHLLEGVPLALLEAGIAPKDVLALLIDNPARALTIDFSSTARHAAAEAE